MPETKSVVKERNSHYGASWFTANEVMYAACQGKAENLQKLLDTGHLANWAIIASKLCRAVASPEDVDHWTDLAGYAELSKALCEGRGEEFGIDPDFFPILPEFDLDEEIPDDEEKWANIRQAIAEVANAEGTSLSKDFYTIQMQVEEPGNWQQLELPLSKEIAEMAEQERDWLNSQNL